ncbi:hypothetical protein [Clostridium beijerinckii]|uniref:hypothetical protein n=1 Tax=Clostridium beijerinckii TaxID=1520 RepID=UPI00156F1A86|nr:hypothetical protein [Clostridium beijerinckii]NRU52365.1 hypothetical protein [Clostridium beijerinckii]NRU52665.1 hypothetical protein [Clostridium beijerinckii]NYC68708.1 hypothetical protein [Clostridium beijerinckii]NYC91857.1 hypothetical protein [Clostridium beijerinckii]
MNYPSDKYKTPKRKLYYGRNEYLIYDIGYGEQGSEMRYSIYRYYICKGNTEEEAVQDWIRQSPFKEQDIKKSEKTGNWLVSDGRSWLRIIPLVGCSDESEEPILKW